MNEQVEDDWKWWEKLAAGFFGVVLVGLLFSMFPLIGYVLSLDRQAQAQVVSANEVAKVGPSNVVLVKQFQSPLAYVESSSGERLIWRAEMPAGVAYPLPGEFWEVAATDTPYRYATVRFVQQRKGFEP